MFILFNIIVMIFLLQQLEQTKILLLKKIIIKSKLPFTTLIYMPGAIIAP